MDPRIHFDNIANSQASSAIHTANTGFSQNWVPVSTKAGKINMNESQLVNKNEQQTIYKIQPQSAYNSNALNSQQIRFQLTNGGYAGSYEKLVLGISLTNNSAGAVGFGDSNALFERAQIVTASGEVVQEGLTLDNYFDLALNNTDEDFSSMCQAMGFDANHNTETTTTAAGATRNYLLTIYSFINTVKPVMSLLAEPVYLELYFRALSPVSGTLTAATFNEIALLVKAKRLGQNEMDHIKREYSRCVMSRYTYWQRQYNDISLAASQTYDVRLQNLNGLSPFFLVTASALPITTANRYQFVALDSMNLVDHTGVSYDINRPANLMKSIIAPENFDSSVFDSKEIYPWSFADDCSACVKYGVNLGYKKFDSAHPDRLLITTPAGLSSGNYRVAISARMYGMIKIENGKLTSIKSG